MREADTIGASSGSGFGYQSSGHLRRFAREFVALDETLWLRSLVREADRFWVLRALVILNADFSRLRLQQGLAKQVSWRVLCIICCGAKR